MSLVRMVPPKGVATSIVVGGRTYTSSDGGAVLVDAGDTFVLSANGWNSVPLWYDAIRQSASITLLAADAAVLSVTPFPITPLPSSLNVQLLNECSLYMLDPSGFCPFTLTDVGVGYVAAPTGCTQACVNGATLANGVGTQLSRKVNNAFAANRFGQRLALGANNPVPIRGAIQTSALNAPGSGFAALDTFTVGGGAGTLVTGVVDTVSGDAIATYHFTNHVNGYLKATGVALTATSGAGTGATIDITALDYSVNHMQLIVSVSFGIVAVS